MSNYFEREQKLHLHSSRLQTHASCLPIFSTNNPKVVSPSLLATMKLITRNRTSRFTQNSKPICVVDCSVSSSTSEPNHLYSPSESLLHSQNIHNLNCTPNTIKSSTTSANSTQAPEEPLHFSKSWESPLRPGHAAGKSSFTSLLSAALLSKSAESACPAESKEKPKAQPLELHPQPKKIGQAKISIPVTATSMQAEYIREFLW